MLPKIIPEDINVELLINYLQEGTCKVIFNGLHKRNAYNDINDIQERKDGSLVIEIGRKSLYNALPEYMFHPIERYEDLSERQKQKLFKEEYERQELEKENAYRFFAPLDLQLLRMRIDVRNRLHHYVEENAVLINILSDSLSDIQKKNRFIKQCIPFLPICKTIRGNKTFLTILIRKVFLEEGISISIHNREYEFCDTEPRYEDRLNTMLNDCFAGNIYDEIVMTYDIHYWSDEECNEHFLQFLEEVEMFQHFIEDYFMPVEGILHFDITTENATILPSDDTTYNYLDYNTNI